MALPRAAASPTAAGVDWSDIDGITLADLSQEHDEYMKWSRLWQDIRLLYRGGWEMLVAAGTGTQTRSSVASQADTGVAILDSMSQPNNRRRRFLWQFEAEPDVKYLSVWERAQYTNYLASIINYFRHWLFSKAPAIRPEPEKTIGETGEEETEQPESPDWWVSFANNCTGGGKDFDAFMKDVFLEASLMRRCGWLIGRVPLPPDVEQSITGQYVTQADAEALGITDSLLTPFTAEEIVDWQEDAAGELVWVVLRKRARLRAFPARRGDVEIYRFVDRNRWVIWQTVSVEGQRGAQLKEMGRGVHGLGTVPFVLFELPMDLWIANQIHAICVQIFNRQNRLHSAELLACFPQPFLKSQDPGAKDRVMGEGILFELMAGNRTTGMEGEELGYVATPIAPYEFIKTSIDATIQELYRAVHQLSLAVDTKAVGSIARSGASKQEDRKSIEVILAAFGGYVRETITRTLNLVSRIQGDETEWSVEGFDDFDVSDLMDELTAAAQVSALDIHSGTFKREMEKRIATGRLMGMASPAVKEAIEREIDEHYDQVAEGEDMPQAADPFAAPGADPSAPPDAASDVPSPTAPDAPPAPEGA